jgi:ribonuclease HI
MADNFLKNENKIIIYTDGGSRGNPGESAIGVVIGGKEYARYIGVATNNQVEYQAVIFALKKVKQVIGKAASKLANIEVRMDSELAVKQLSGQYKIQDKNLQDLFFEIWNLKPDFKSVLFSYIPREKNKIADNLVNQALDEREKLSKNRLF